MEQEATPLSGMQLGKESEREQEEEVCEVDLMTNTRHDKELVNYRQMRDMFILVVLEGVIEQISRANKEDVHEVDLLISTGIEKSRQ